MPKLRGYQLDYCVKCSVVDVAFFERNPGKSDLPMSPIQGGALLMQLKSGSKLMDSVPSKYY